MNNKLEWNLKEIYESEETFEKDVNSLQEKTKEIVALKGKLSEGSNRVLECFKKLTEALELERRLTGLRTLPVFEKYSDKSCV